MPDVTRRSALPVNAPPGVAEDRITRDPLMHAARWLTSVVLWLVAALAAMQTLIALGVPAFVAWAVAFLVVCLFIAVFVRPTCGPPDQARSDKTVTLTPPPSGSARRCAQRARST